MVKNRGGIIRASSWEPLWVVGDQLSTVTPWCRGEINGRQEPGPLIGESDHPALTVCKI